jgi:hypothetical protein
MMQLFSISPFKGHGSFPKPNDLNEKQAKLFIIYVLVGKTSFYVFSDFISRVLMTESECIYLFDMSSLADSFSVFFLRQGGEAGVVLVSSYCFSSILSFLLTRCRI